MQIGERQERRQQGQAAPDREPQAEQLQRQRVGDHHQVHTERQRAQVLRGNRHKGQLKDIQGKIILSYFIF